MPAQGLLQDPVAEVDATTSVPPSLFGRFRNRLNNKGKNKPLPSLRDTSSDVYTASPRHFIIPSPTPALTFPPSRRSNITALTLVPTTQTAEQPSGTTFDAASSRYLSVRHHGGLGNSAMITAQPLRNQFTHPHALRYVRFEWARPACCRAELQFDGGECQCG